MNIAMDGPPYDMTSLTMVLFGLSSMLDSGKHDDITIEDIKQHSRRGDLFEFLEARNDGSFAMGIMKMRPSFAQWFAALIEENCGAMSGRERRKYGVERRGLCLLISYTAEILQTDKVPIALTDHSRRY